MKGKVSIVGFLAIIFSVVVIVGVFLDWYTGTISIVGLFEISGSATGWDIYNDYSNVTDYYYFPLIVLILGILGVLISLLELAGVGNVATRALLLLMGLAIAILAYLTFSDLDKIIPVDISMGSGLYMAIGGGALMFVSGLFGMFTARSD